MNWLCLAEGGGEVFGELSPGGIGVLVFGAGGVTLAGNTVDVGTNALASLGMAVFGAQETTMVDNDVTVGRSTSSNPRPWPN